MITIRNYLKRKGQGIVEYALLLAFVVGIAIMMNSASLKDSVVSVFDYVATHLGGEKTYAQYFAEWHGYKSSEQLRNDASNADRIKADQAALVKLASAFLGKEANDVLELMENFSSEYLTGGTPNWIKNNFSQYGPPNSSNEGWSGVLVPLSYKDMSLDDNGYLWLESNNNANTIQFLADNKAEGVYMRGSGTNVTVTNAAGQSSQVNVGNADGGKTISADRVFFSDDMIKTGNDSAKNRTVTVQLHYTDGKVDKVNIAARKGTGAKGTSAAAASQLDLTVTGSSSNPNVQVNNP